MFYFVGVSCSPRTRVCAFGLIIFLLHSVGCTRQLEVTGEVTLDNVPLPDAYISFTSVEGEGDVFITTANTKGEYRLPYPGTAQEMVPGRYLVRISTFQEGIPEADPPVRSVPERVPSRYNVDSEVIVDVDRERTVHNFDLESDDASARRR